ncbi:MAG: hypothetical protein ABIH34_01210 [Nanoarchaeota archaeon]
MTNTEWCIGQKIYSYDLMNDNLIFIGEGLRMLKRRIKVGLGGYEKYPGDADKICKQIVERCWNGQYFMTSAGHFCEFWTRDFGMCVDSLLALGHRDRIRKTLHYALDHFKNAGRITTTITPGGKPFNFPTYAPDSVAFLLHSIKQCNDPSLLETYRPFLQQEIDHYAKTVLVEGKLRKDKTFSSMMDHSKKTASCYDWCVVGMVAQRCKELGFSFPSLAIKEVLQKEYQTEKGYIDDLSPGAPITADANIFPYWCGLDKDGKKGVEAIRKLGLDKPLPVRYSNEHTQMNVFDLFAPGYESPKVIWLHLGMAYLQVVAKARPSLLKDYVTKIRQFILEHHNFLEVMRSQDKPFETLFYAADESMLWAANALALGKAI